MFDGILFDLDGTLWDAVAEIALSWNLGAAQCGVDCPPITEQALRPMMGILLYDIGKRLFPGLDDARRAQVLERCCRLECGYLAEHGARLYPGEEAVLKELAGRCPLFVVSNCQDGYIQAFFQGTGLGGYFTGFECAGRTGRPKSDNIRLVADRYGLERPVYVGDTQLDQSSAREAGVAFLHAAYGFGEAPGAAAVEEFKSIPQALERLSGLPFALAGPF